MAGIPNIDVKALMKSGFDKALVGQHPVAKANVERLRRVRPGKTPPEMLAYVDKIYLAAVTITGAGAGAAAIVPNIAVQIPVGLGEALTFLEASVLYTLSVAEIYGVDLEDIEMRRLLVMAALVGDATSQAVLKPILGKSVPHWGKAIVKRIPMEAINRANKVLGPRFIAKWAGKTSALVLGKQVPFFIGVGVGGVGNQLFGRAVIKATKTILGPPPGVWDESRSSVQTENPSD